MRHVGQAILGVINVRLLLLESMILFLSREPFMKACLTNTSEHNWAQVVNLLWITLVLSAITYIDWFVNCIIYLWLLTKSYIYIYIFTALIIFFRVPICIVMSSLFGYIWLFFLSTSESLPPYYTFAVWAVALSCIIELSSLIVQLVANAFLFVKLKVNKFTFTLLYFNYFYAINI